MASTVGLKINGVLVRGKSARYARRYRDVLWRARLSAVYNAAVQRSSGKNWDRSCAWDCGPHGSCRYGISINLCYYLLIYVIMVRCASAFGWVNSRL